MKRYALDATSEDLDTAAPVGINITYQKLRITAISAVMPTCGQWFG